jgi:hypothetical protein
MHRSRRLAFWIVHLTVLLLLLKAAVPLLASSAAYLQGKGVGEICEIYGVVLTKPGANAEHGEHAHHAHRMNHGEELASGEEPWSRQQKHSSGVHPGGDHCALTALGVFGTTDCSAAFSAPATSSSGQPSWHAASRAHDASRLWAARLQHGPPLIS